MISNSKYRDKLEKHHRYKEIVHNSFVDKYVQKVIYLTLIPDLIQDNVQNVINFKHGGIVVKKGMETRGRERVRTTTIELIIYSHNQHYPKGCNLHWIILGLTHYFWNYGLKHFKPTDFALSHRFELHYLDYIQDNGYRHVPESNTNLFELFQWVSFYEKTLQEN